MTTTTRIITAKKRIYYEAATKNARQSTAMAAGRERCCRIFDNTAGRHEKRNENTKRIVERMQLALLYSTSLVLPIDTTAPATDQRNWGDVEGKKSETYKKRQLLVHRRATEGY